MAEVGPSQEPHKTSKSERNRRPYHTDVRKVVAKVIQTVEIEKSNKQLICPLNQALNRASAYTGISIATVRRIKAVVASHPDESPRTPGRKRMRTRGKAMLDDCEKRVIRKTIEDFYTVQKVVPTVGKILPVLCDKINWKWERTTLRNTLHSMGFVWKKVQNKRTLLLERADIVDWRSRFIAQMKHFRKENREIFYLDESWVDNKLSTGKCWHNKSDMMGVATSGSSSKRLIIASVGSRRGFIPDAQLIFETRSTQGDYRGQMDSENFENWFRTKVLGNLPPASIIVLDNAPYHSRQIDKPPSRYDTKVTMIQWLQRKGIVCDLEMRKNVLYSLIKAKKPVQKLYAVDLMAFEEGHTVVRLPPYNCDLNAMELAWAKIKRVFKECHITGDMPAQHLHQLTIQAFSSVTSTDLEQYCKDVEQLEAEYWKRDGIIENSIDEIIINTPSNWSEDSENSSEDSDTDTE